MKICGELHVLTWVLLITYQLACGSQEIRTMDRRLLLNDPNTLMSHIETLQREMASLTTKVTTCNTEVTKLNTEVTSQQAKINKLENQKGTGSVYTVWGRKSCPAVNGTTTVYTGITGGKPWQEKGGGVTTLCLPHNPDDAPNNFPYSLQLSGYVSHLYGSEYQFIYRNIAKDDDVPCAVCHVTIATSSLMIPAKSTCPSEWTMQYNGYLVSDYFDYSAYDYICLHNDAEYMTEGSRRHNDNGHILYPVQAICGSLPCPPYKDGQYITCVVCSL